MIEAYKNVYKRIMKELGFFDFQDSKDWEGSFVDWLERNYGDK